MNSVSFLGASHHFGINAKFGKMSFFAPRFPRTHAGPDIGRNEVGIFHRIMRIRKLLIMIGAIKPARSGSTS